MLIRRATDRNHNSSSASRLECRRRPAAALNGKSTLTTQTDPKTDRSPRSASCLRKDCPCRASGCRPIVSSALPRARWARRWIGAQIGASCAAPGPGSPSDARGSDRGGRLRAGGDPAPTPRSQGFSSESRRSAFARTAAERTDQTQPIDEQPSRAKSRWRCRATSPAKRFAA